MLIGTISVFILLFLVFLGVPIAFALFTVGMLGILYLEGWDILVSTTGTLCLDYIAQYGLAVVPLFIFMGQLGYHSGLLSDIFEVARRWLGRLRGGLALSVVAADSIFAACSGSSIAACVVIGKASIPVMRKAGYSPEMATGVVAASGTLASLIPPSVNICVYGLLVSESVGKLLIAGIIPGIVSAILYMAFIMVRSRGIPAAEESFTWRKRIYSIRHLWVMVVIVIAIMGGIYFGICTPTEGGAVGALVVFLLALFTRKLDWSIFRISVRTTIVTTGMVFIIVIAAVLYARFLTLAGFSEGLTTAIAATQASPLVVFLLVTVLYFILGCFIGGMGMMIMTLPIIYPLMLSVGFDSIWFGIIMVKYVEMAFITPPVGINLYAVQSIVSDISLGTIIRGAAPFLIMDLLTIGLFYVFPQIVTFLPSMM